MSIERNYEGDNGIVTVEILNEGEFTKAKSNQPGAKNTVQFAGLPTTSKMRYEKLKKGIMKAGTYKPEQCTDAELEALFPVNMEQAPTTTPTTPEPTPTQWVAPIDPATNQPYVNPATGQMYTQQEWIQATAQAPPAPPVTTTP